MRLNLNTFIRICQEFYTVIMSCIHTRKISQKSHENKNNLPITNQMIIRRSKNNNILGEEKKGHDGKELNRKETIDNDEEIL